MSDSAKTAAPRKRKYRRPRAVTPARWAAWQTLQRTFDDKAWTDRAFAGICENMSLEGRERGFAQLLAYGAVQHAKLLDYVIATLGKRPLRKLDSPVLDALRIGVYELVILDGDDSAHAAVSQAVELVRGTTGERAVAFTNAILRRAQVDARTIIERLDPASDEDLATLISMPDWLVKRAREDHGSEGVVALQAQNDTQTFGTAFRRNKAWPNQKHAMQLLNETAAQVRIDTPLRVPDSVVLRGSTAPISDLVEQGAFVPQSLSSQLVTLALEPDLGDRILDMCAAPGGKTTHIAALLGGSGEVIATELHEHRADSIVKLAERTHTDEAIEVHTADATALTVEEYGTFDRILLDAPCSGTGVLAARPDSRWRRSEDDLGELVELQRALMRQSYELLEPGGVLLYSTCSILRAEDEDIADYAEEIGFTPEELPLEVIRSLDLPAGSTRARIWPQHHESEGFFMARFVKDR